MAGSPEKSIPTFTPRHGESDRTNAVIKPPLRPDDDADESFDPYLRTPYTDDFIQQAIYNTAITDNGNPVIRPERADDE